MSVSKAHEITVFLKTWLYSMMAMLFVGSAVILTIGLGTPRDHMPSCTHYLPMMTNVTPDIRC